MSYTPSPNRPMANSPRSNFGGLVVDGNRIGMTGALGNNFVTQDATASPVTSPLTVNTTATLTVPSSAISLTIVSTTNPVRVTEDSFHAAYFTLPAGVVQTFDVAREQYVYLQTTGSTVVNFFFTEV